MRASLDITYACDLRCIHCRTNTGEIPIEIRRRMLSNAQLASVIDQLDEMQVFEITLTGGEPTMRKAFWDLLPTLGRLEFSTVTLITNAYALDQEKMDRIVAAGIDSVRVSIDGTRPVFEAVRKADALPIVLQNAAYLRERVASMKVLTTAMKTNYHDLFDLVELLRREGFRRQDIILVRAHGRGGRNRLLLDEDEATELMRRVRDFRSTVRPEEYDLNMNAPFLIPGESVEGPEDVVLYPYTHKNSSVAISATGDVTMNRLFSPVAVGNVKSASLRDIWRSGQDQLEAEAREFDDKRLREIFWSFNDDKAPALTSLLDRQIFGDAQVE